MKLSWEKFSLQYVCIFPLEHVRLAWQQKYCKRVAAGGM